MPPCIYMSAYTLACSVYFLTRVSAWIFARGSALYVKLLTHVCSTPMTLCMGVCSVPEGGERQEPEPELQEALLIGCLEDKFMHREVVGVLSSWLLV